ncbi:hypothetical protein LTR95_011233 [Oleoguttula sp. CCFEE 5521]
MAPKRAAAATAVGTRKSVRGKGKRKQEDEEEEQDPSAEENEQPRPKKAKTKKAPAKKPAKKQNEGDDGGGDPDPQPRPQKAVKKPAAKKGKKKAAPAPPASEEQPGVAPTELVGLLRAYTMQTRPDGWQMRLLGEGGYGAAYVLWRDDENGNVSERKAMKDTLIKREVWNAWTKWSGHPADKTKCEHVESHMMKALTDAGSPNTVQYLGHVRQDDRYFLRMFMAYCPFRDLHKMMPAAYVTLKRDATTLHSRAKQDPDIPEAALWKFFLDLTNAACYMAFGRLDGSKGPVEGWRPIVHRDLKPGNVFLSEPKENYWPSYPTARVADFGLSVYTDLEDPENPQAYSSEYTVGTPGWRPLEQYVAWKANGQPEAQGRLDPDKTNVWGIGAIMMRLMTRVSDPRTPEYSGVDLEADIPIPEFSGPEQDRFTDLLQNLVNFCVQRRPEDHISLVELRQELLSHIEEDDDLSRLQRGEQEDGEAEGEYDWTPLRLDRYKLGLVRKRLF